MEDITKALNKFIKNNFALNGKFIQHKTYITNTNFKSLKTYTLHLYYVSKGKTYPIIEETVTVKETDSNIANTELNIKFLEAVFDYVSSDEFRDLVNGKINI